jgi:sugar phosphate isomerase/epimerase
MLRPCFKRRALYFNQWSSFALSLAAVHARARKVGATEVEAPPADVAPAAAPDFDDFEASLREYDEAFAPAAKGNVEDPPPDPAKRVDELREQIDATKQIGQLREWALGVEYERLERREAEATAAVFQAGKQMVASSIPAGRLRRAMATRGVHDRPRTA